MTYMIDIISFNANSMNDSMISYEKICFFSSRKTCVSSTINLKSEFKFLTLNESFMLALRYVSPSDNHFIIHNVFFYSFLEKVISNFTLFDNINLNKISILTGIFVNLSLIHFTKFVEVS